jgi:hypothetical protein
VYVRESKAEMTWHVLKEAVLRPNSPDDSRNMRPKVSWVGFPLSLACEAERLARVARKDEIKAASKSLCREGSQVRPQSLDSQATFRSLCLQVRHGVGFDLHCNDSQRVCQCAGKSELQAAVAAA